MFVWNGEHIIEKEITYTPGLYKIFDEILVNAADNKQRSENTDRIDISINASENIIQVKNNGKGIPVAIHQEHQCYVPTLIFGAWLS
jgi:DNA topoisomerase-2